MGINPVLLSSHITAVVCRDRSTKRESVSVSFFRSLYFFLLLQGFFAGSGLLEGFPGFGSDLGFGCFVFSFIFSPLLSMVHLSAILNRIFSDISY